MNKAGPTKNQRRELYNFVVEEFKKLEILESHRISVMRITLENKAREAALGFVDVDLLRFYFNHTHFLRSTRAERHKKSPAEILSGKPHPHWLEMLGFERFKRAA